MKEEIIKSTEILKQGGIILYPTDTIWGIGCDATNSESINRIFQIKGREDSKSLIILASDMDMVAKYVKEIPPMAISLDEVNDKPMTIIYPNAINLPENLIAEDGTIAIRIPRCEFCRELIRKFGKPIVSTSANISGEKSPKNHSEISTQIKESVDYQVHPSMDRESTGRASSIIKLGMNYEVKIIRE